MNKVNAASVVTTINIADLPSMDHDRAEWLKNRWAMFWGACDYATRTSMIDAAHAEALQMHSEMTLLKVAYECRARFQTGTPKREVVADWNSAARHANRLDLGLAIDCANLQEALKFRASILDRSVWK